MLPIESGKVGGSLWMLVVRKAQMGGSGIYEGRGNNLEKTMEEWRNLFYIVIDAL